MAIIKNQNYGTSSAPQYAGFAPNANSGALTGEALTTSAKFIEAGFKDHKTVFVFNNTGSGAVTVTFAAGNSYAAKSLSVSVPQGISCMWIDSAPFIKADGTIEVKASATGVSLFGYEMR